MGKLWAHVLGSENDGSVLLEKPPGGGWAGACSPYPNLMPPGGDLLPAWGPWEAGNITDPFMDHILGEML